MVLVLTVVGTAQAHDGYVQFDPKSSHVDTNGHVQLYFYNSDGNPRPVIVLIQGNPVGTSDGQPIPPHKGVYINVGARPTGVTFKYTDQPSDKPSAMADGQFTPAKEKEKPDDNRVKWFLDIKWFVDRFEHWRQAVTNPEQYLKPGFQPTEEQLFNGLDFFFAMLLLSLVIYAPLGAKKQGDFTDKSKVAINAVLGLLFAGAVANAWYFAFWLLGGTASFSGTFLAYVYAASPFVPIMALASLIIARGLPPHLQHLAVNPKTARDAFKQAKDDPRTSQGMVGLGGIAWWGVLGWSACVLLRCFSFIHEVGGWKFVGAIALSALSVVVIAGLVGPILQWLSRLFGGDEDDTPDSGVSAALANIQAQNAQILGLLQVQKQPAPVVVEEPRAGQLLRSN
jgi:hypothetical protein